MEWLVWVLAIIVLGFGAVIASGRWGELPSTITDAPRPHVPQGVLTGDDLISCRFDVVMRGYSMAQVDELLDRLAEQLRARESTNSGEEWNNSCDVSHEEVR